MALKKRRRPAGKSRTNASGRLPDGHAAGATPLAPEHLHELKLHATTHAELNELEAENILSGWRWAVRSTKSRMPGMLTTAYLLELHKHMFGDVWSWAGKFRQQELNIGVDPAQIPERLAVALGDARYWLEAGTFQPAELVIRLHHRVVQVHAFQNGNGRLARMLADLLLIKHFRLARLPWGGTVLGHTHPRRDEYLAAIRSADAHDYAPLVKFCQGS